MKEHEMRCLLTIDFALVMRPLLAGDLTYSSHVARIVYDNCSGCHHTGQSGPFSLMSYDDVKRHSETIVAVTGDKFMPPWKPVHTGIAFANNRQLSAEQIEILAKWVDSGCPEGDRSKTPEPPEYKDGWTLGSPDIVIKMAAPFEIPADGPDIYRSFVMPVNLSEDRWIKAIELRPTARGAIHHALFFIDPTGNARNQRERDGLTGLKGMNFLRGSGASFLNSGPERLASGMGGFVPGAVPNRLPGDLARLLPKGSDIIMQTHFHPAGKKEVEQAELALYFTDITPSHLLVPIQLPPLFGIGAGIDIAPNESSFRIVHEYELPIDVKAIEIGGHAHYICREMLLVAELPNHQRKELLRIDDWDLGWQDQYQFVDAIDLPKGTKLTATIIYDNSSSNPENPFSPPQRIQWGRESTDEMGAITLLVVATNEQQRTVLESDLRTQTRESLRKRVQSQTGSFTRLTGGRLGQGQMAKLLDRNGDGILQADEIPAAFRDRLLDLFDADSNDELSANELKIMRDSLAELTK